MRDYLVLAAVFAALPFCFYRPYIGVLCWVWLGLMNPHRLAWGVAYDFPVAALVGGATLAGLAFALVRREILPIPKTRETWLLGLFWIVVTFTTVVAFDSRIAWEHWMTWSKTLLISVVALVLFQDATKLRYLILVMAASIGLFGVKGGLFGIATAGQYIVFGPPESFIADNNALALAELMVLPLLFYLGKVEERRWWRVGFYAMGALTMLSILLSYSRGALLGLIAMSGLLALNSSRKLLAGLLLAIGALAALAFVPDRWYERMSTITTYQEDPSAMSRINGWIFAYRLAWDYPFTGGGFGAFNKDLFARYAPMPDVVYNGHSIYFQVLGEHGFLGLGVFVALLISAFLSLERIKKTVVYVEGLDWAYEYAKMLQLALTAFAISGAFLPLAYFDLYYYLIVVVILLKVVVRSELQAGMEEDAEEPVAEPRSYEVAGVGSR